MNLSAAHISDHSDKSKLSSAPRLFCENASVAAVSKTYEPRQDVFYQGDIKGSVHQVESGAVCLYRTLANGKRQIFDFAFAGDVIGLGASSAYTYSAQTIGLVTLKSVPMSKIRMWASRDPEFAFGLYQAISSELEATRDLLLSLGQQSALERVAIFLLTLSERNRRNGRNPHLLAIPMTRSDIGDLLGLTIETVSRCLTKLRRQKSIDIIRGSIVQIIAPESLKAVAGAVSIH
jgi:CRP/FNR family transcriptional regulator, anaerobic regulatory protein